MTTESTQLQIPLFPEDIVITDRVADFIRTLLRPTNNVEAWFKVACTVVSYWAVGFTDRSIELPEGVTFEGGSVAPAFIVWEEFGLAHVDKWVREDNHLPEPGWVPLAELVP